MISKVDIVNIALSHLGVSKKLSNVETDKGQEAESARTFYDIALHSTLRACQWPFATCFATLNLVVNNPTIEWDYSYRVPSDSLFVRRILSGAAVETRQTRVPYILARDSEGKTIFTNKETAQAEYTALVTDTNQYPPDFSMALSHMLAQLMAPRLTGGDPFGLQEKSFKLYGMAIRDAQATAFNEQQEAEHPEAEAIRARY